MNQFPEYLEEWLKIVELNIHLYRSTEKAHELVNVLRELIERYEHERVSINAARLGRLEKAVQDVIGQSCEDWCESVMGEGADCTCHVGRLKAALDP